MTFKVIFEGHCGCWKNENTPIPSHNQKLLEICIPVVMISFLRSVALQCAGML